MEANYIERIAFQYCVKSEIYQVSYRQYIDDVKKFALYLREKYEDTEGKHIAVLSRDTYRMAVCISGIIYAKAVAVPLNIEENEQEIISLIESADVEQMFEIEIDDDTVMECLSLKDIIDYIEGVINE